MKRLLLGSGGLSTDERRKAWVQDLDAFLGPVRRIVFLPYALKDHDAYARKIVELGFQAGRELINLPNCKNVKEALQGADAIYVGGGNTFRLLSDVYKLDLLKILREKVLSGTPYIGISAGTNLSGPTVKTTNDMPITWPPSLEALGLVPFQINPHYFAGALHYETETGLTRYGGETRDDRIREFHEMNDSPVVGLWEGVSLRVEDKKASLVGAGKGCRIFRKGQEPENRPLGADLSDLLS